MDKNDYLAILQPKKGSELYIRELIGEGATSNVFLALDKDNNEYAIKIYNNEEAFSNETSKLMNFKSSKNIVKLLSYGQGRLERGYSLNSCQLSNYLTKEIINYAIFEYLKNGKLSDYVWVYGKKFTEDISKKLFIDLIKAVETCHKSGITHGDIKLENILLSSNFNLKLIDFGFARFIHEGPISEISGTQFYTAPEVMCFATKSYDGIASDIFSMGVVLFILVMGMYPYDKPKIKDKRYMNLMKKEFGFFWKKCEQKMTAGSGGSSSPEFKDLFEKMINFKPEERISLSEIKKHPWLKDFSKQIFNESEKKIDFESSDEDINTENTFSPKKSQIKHKQLNLSFKKEKSSTNLEYIKYNKINNFSDGFCQVHINENNLLKMNNSIEKEKNSKIKDIENKYIQELMKRKARIDHKKENE